ncbi:branched-chain amino acid ABC transporter permease [Synechococcus sp. PCC 6312]|uniref:branched-chain amino acid ABC transporter permease n=1 Tax=Synechococcus sp. (strain ATCC 27167 / PCC 6312) TaxID=195253 RepID=UPI00029EC399|nr:branched-chain amino acid ABC transporter permease [Synechococcus sp. PCC 6312]AFY61579.1 ABC-type branched-chain amino acid transport system, permease component [Synechococcus sp. PCC 6312]
MVGYLVSLGIFTATFALFSLGLSLHWGFTGLINFGHVGFLAVGAYTTVLLSLANVPLVLAVLAGMLLSALLGVIMGFSTLRLREDYLAIVTIGTAEIIRLIALNEEWLTRGARGVYGYALPLEGWEPQRFWVVGMILVLTVIAALGGWHWWQWLGGMIDMPLRVNQPRRGVGILGAYLLTLVGLEWSLWSLIDQLLAGGGVQVFWLLTALLCWAAGVGLLSLRYVNPRQLWRSLRREWLWLWGVNTLVAGLVGMLYRAFVTGLWEFTYKAVLLWLLLVVLAIVFWQLETWVRSPWGRVLKAIREDEEVAKALGKNVFSYKLQSLMLGGAIAGLAGSFYAWQLTFINPDGFISLLTFQAWTIVVLGGAGSNVGVLIGATLFWAYSTTTRFLPLDGGQLDALRVMIIGLLLIILMMWRPQGILGKKEELTLGR